MSSSTKETLTEVISRNDIIEDLKKLGVVLKRAQYFITCGGKVRSGLQFSAATLIRQLEAIEQGQLPSTQMQQVSLYDPAG